MSAPKKQPVVITDRAAIIQLLTKSTCPNCGLPVTEVECKMYDRWARIKFTAARTAYNRKVAACDLCRAEDV